MPTLWNDLTTDEAAEQAGLANRSVIIARIHQSKQPATKATTKGKRWRYWITETELEDTMTRWPKWAKKEIQETLRGLPPAPQTPTLAPPLLPASPSRPEHNTQHPISAAAKKQQPLTNHTHHGTTTPDTKTGEPT